MPEETKAASYQVQLDQLRQELDRVRESEQRLSLAMEAIHDGLWDYNIEKNQVFFNPQYYIMLGYEPYELPQSRQTWIDLMHPDDRERSVNYVDECIRTEKGWSLEFRMQAKDGSYRWIMGRGHVALRDNNGSPLRRVGTHTDITEKKEAALEREHLIRELKESQETVQALNGMLPICSTCKKIRDDEGYWNRLEEYIQSHSEALFTHSLCPDCIEDLYGDKDWYKKRKKKPTGDLPCCDKKEQSK